MLPLRLACVLAAPLVLATLGSGCDGPGGTKVARADASAAAVARVATVRPERATIRRITEQPGWIEAEEVAPIHAKVAGYVRAVAVDIGDRVAKGQVLAEIEAPELEADVAQTRALVDQGEAERRQAEAAVGVTRAGIETAKARLIESRAGIKRAEADAARWEAEFQRVQQLVRESATTASLLDETRNKRLAAEATRDEVRAAAQSAEAALAESQALLEKANADVGTAKAKVEVARADQRRAEALAGYTKIVAPFDGTVIRRSVDTGHLTRTGTEGEPLFTVSRAGLVTVTVGVPEIDAPLVNPGDPARVRLQALEGRTFEGKVTRTAWALDAATRTLRAEIDLPNDDGLLRPGLYAYVSIIAEEHPDVLTVPVTAVVHDGEAAYCVVVSSGRAVRTPIQIGLVDRTRAEVVSGLDGDEAVVKANAGSLTDGQPVELAEPEPTAAPTPKP